MPNLHPPPDELPIAATVMGFDLRDLDGLRRVSLVDLADYMGEVATRAKVVRMLFEDGDYAVSDDVMREAVDDMNGHLVLVAELMAYRLPREL